MTDDSDVDGTTDQRPDGLDSNLEDAGSEVSSDPHAGGDPPTRGEWERLPSNPDPEKNLGYELVEWEEFTAIDGTDQVMYLPADEAVLHDDAFIVAEGSAVCDLEDRC